MALASDNAKASKRNGRATSNLGHVRWEGKKEKGDHYYIQTRNNDIFSHDNLILKAPKGARKY